MRKFLFVPVLLIMMLGVAAAENLEITEVNIVIKIVNEVGTYLENDNSPLETIEQQQALVDHIGNTIVYEKYNIEAYGVMLLADTETNIPVKLILILDLVFSEYSYMFNLVTGERTIL